MQWVDHTFVKTASCCWELESVLSESISATFVADMRVWGDAQCHAPVTRTMSPLESRFDVLVYGTGLPQSIVAA